jgi:hypothetical protein
MIKKALLFTALFSLTSFLGCSEARLDEASATCQSADWFERGRQDGSTGENPRVEKYRQQCSKVFNEETKGLYMAGFHSGLNDYCSPENAFKVGEMGGSSENLCPEVMKEAFLKAFKNGAHSRLLKNQNQELAQKIQNLSRKVASREISSVDKQPISSELEELKRQYAQNQKRLSRMNN